MRVMTGEASTSADIEATRGPATGVGRYVMVRTFLIILAAGLIALAAGFLYLGAFPPGAHVQTIEKVLPNDKFQSH
ncbi:MAG TPA: hypothetical protein VFE41_10940 [Acetobacteraceae bacterium]|nr:hypothetical protein [Acetobacteraceae bacterium]